MFFCKNCKCLKAFTFYKVITVQYYPHPSRNGFEFRSTEANQAPPRLAKAHCVNPVCNSYNKEETLPKFVTPENLHKIFDQYLKRKKKEEQHETHLPTMP